MELDTTPAAQKHALGGPSRVSVIPSSTVLTVAITLVLAVALYAWQGQRQYVHEPLHATIEAVGGCIALGMAAVLISRWLEGGPSHFQWMATALLSMGLLDLAHGSIGTSAAFFWSRALPTLVGGTLMAMVWLPSTGAQRRLRLLQPPLVAVAATLPVCLLLVLAPSVWPNPFDSHGAYYAWAKALNVVGGVGFAVSAVFFLRRSQVSQRLEANLAFGNHCVLFALAGILFGLSFIWGPVWWLFHLVRLGAYVVVLTYSVDAYRRTREHREAARQLEFERRLVGIVSHDLRNPLAAMQVTTHVLLSHDLPDNASRALQRLSRSADRMNRMLTDLLDYSRSRAAGALPIEPAEIDFSHLAERVRDEAAAAHPGCMIRCETRGDCTGSGDPDRIHQVLANLVENAIKHGDSTQPIVIHTSGDRDTLALEVQNSGEPIPEALLPRIFEPFASGAGKAGRKSFGLGLYIAREIVRAHGGEITVTSDRDRTRFRVVLPRERPRGGSS